MDKIDFTQLEDLRLKILEVSGMDVKLLVRKNKVNPNPKKDVYYNLPFIPIFCWLANKNYSLKKIGIYLGGISHCNILYHRNIAEFRINNDKNYSDLLDKINEKYKIEEISEPIKQIEFLMNKCKSAIKYSDNEQKISLRINIEQYNIAINAIKSYGEVK